MPSTSFEQSAKWLDTRRLGKQRVECLQILKALTDPSYGWQNHPAVKMWRGYEYTLIYYGWTTCMEWTKRGYKDNCLDKILDFNIHCSHILNYPTWLTEDFASNHRSILLGKAFEKRDSLDLNLAKCLDLRDGLTINSIEEIELTKQARKIYRQIQKSELVVKWYHSFGWSEQPAQRVMIDGKLRWPYTWPEMEK